ncbi:hypothetical protein O7631_04360 [Micromonospora sp. WMMD967]|uniref:hypothetical protein n=1 Tax=Micromonospora sp. WMMD967 TaxID=3016101 RepID=UPI00241637BB|nr:hypothetical protein [Micromonospora sp. WMMD967]MDG4835745.1 hypothetical protein [Micromonospora sp. WMMD967]
MRGPAGVTGARDAATQSAVTCPFWAALGLLTAFLAVLLDYEAWTRIRSGRSVDPVEL